MLTVLSSFASVIPRAEMVVLNAMFAILLFWKVNYLNLDV